MVKNTCGIFIVSIWLLSILACAQYKTDKNDNLNSNGATGCPTMTWTSCSSTIPYTNEYMIDNFGCYIPEDGDNVVCPDLYVPISTCNLSPQAGGSITSNYDCGGTGFRDGTPVLATDNPCWCRSGVIGCAIDLNNDDNCDDMPVCLEPSSLIYTCSP